MKYMTWNKSWKSRLRQVSVTDSQTRMRKFRLTPMLLARLAVLSFILVLAGFIGFALILPIFAWNLPSPDKIVRQEGFSTKILDRNSAPIYDIFVNQRRTPVKLNDIPVYLRQATIAIEDKNFYKHQGFDPTGIFRAALRTFTSGRLQGGSTLTQQLVKTVLLSPERTIIRKIREFVLAVQIERKYTKDEILQMYLNEAPYGGTAYGVEAATETYFSKKVQDLNLVESAILAGLPQRPSYYSPFSTQPEAFKDRTTQVLRRMREDGYITPDQEKAAVKDLGQIKFDNKSPSFKAPHFVFYVKSLLEERYGEQVVEQGGLTVTTTLDLDLQGKAQEIVSEEIARVENLHITNGAALVIDPATGEILAMVGSKGYDAPDYDGKVNVTLSLRQPGSAIKPVTYVTALKQGFTAASLLMDTPTEFPGGADNPIYKPVNYDGKFHGSMQVRFALGNSINVAAVKMLAKVGIENMLKTAFSMGISTLEPTRENLSRFGLSVTLGGGEVRLLELTSAYSAFANGGKKVEPVAILKIQDRDGKVLEEYKPVPGKQVITPEQAFIISHILSDNNARLETFGPNSQLNISGRQIAVKTGTTNDKRDNWTIGWTPQAAVGVWVGNNDNSPMKQVSSGVSGASPIWRRIILEALKGKSTEGFPIPSSVVTAEVDTVSGYRAHDGFPSRMEYFIKGTEPQGDDPIHARLKVCRGQDGLATPSDIARGDYEDKEYFVFKEEDPFAAPGEPNRWQTGILEWLATQPDSRYHPPSGYCNSQASPIVLEFTSPQDKQQIDSSDISVKLKAESTSKITKIEVFADGTQKGELTDRPFELQFSLSDGTHTLKAKAYDQDNHQTEVEIKIGVNKPWDWSPSTTPSPSLSVTPTPTP